MSQLAEQNQANGQKPSLVKKFADTYGVEANKMLQTLTSTAFRQKGDQPISNEQMMALLIVADQYKLNPFTKEIYAFPDKNAGIVPIVGVDGWSRIINQHEAFDGMKFTAAEEKIQIDEHHRPAPEYITCTIYRKDRSHPIEVTEYLDEVYRPPFIKNGTPYKGPWQTHTKRFLRHKSMIQCARLAFGFVGIYDQDEGQQIIEGESQRAEVRNVTPERPQSEPQTKTDSVKQKLQGESEQAEQAPSEDEAQAVTFDELASAIKDSENEDQVADALSLSDQLTQSEADAIENMAKTRYEELKQEGAA